MMEGVPLRSPQGRDERLNGSVADAIAARDEEVRELWSMVQQKDADLRSAAELGERLCPVADSAFEESGKLHPLVLDAQTNRP